MSRVLIPLLFLFPIGTYFYYLPTTLPASWVSSHCFISILTYISTTILIPIIQKFTLRANLKGKDLCKKGTPTENEQIPESLGIVSGVVYLISITFCQVIYGDTPAKLIEYNAAMHSICFMLFLGFADDVLDIPWRYKLFLPCIATLPILIAYEGPTNVVVPFPLVRLLGTSVHLGVFYKFYMLLVAIFCTNSINILAGVNGLEAGQSLVIAIASLTHNIVEIAKAGPSADAHFFSLVLLIPFIGSVCGLLEWNWYPSEVFVGDTFTLFAGMTIAVAGILGHYSKTLLLFFIPQILNFLYSTPQLFGFLPCPRHRLPRYAQGPITTHSLDTTWKLGNYTA